MKSIYETQWLVNSWASVEKTIFKLGNDKYYFEACMLLCSSVSKCLEKNQSILDYLSLETNLQRSFIFQKITPLLTFDFSNSWEYWFKCILYISLRLRIKLLQDFNSKQNKIFYIAFAFALCDNYLFSVLLNSIRNSHLATMCCSILLRLMNEVS